MDNSLFRDLEGDFGKSGEQLVKRLSLDTAWVVPVLDDLSDACEGIIVDVTTPTANTVLLHYDGSIKILDAQALYKLIQPSGIFGMRRLLTLALQLARHLEDLHYEDVPQLIIHPQRVAHDGKRFILLPSPAGVLPPFPQLLAEKRLHWLAFVSPENIRTRGLVSEYYESGDVYALGKTLLVITQGQNPSFEISDAYTILEAQVEDPTEISVENASDSLQPMLNLIRAMCAPEPETRPRLEDVIEELDSLFASTRPVLAYLDDLLRTQSFTRLEIAINELKPLLNTPAAEIRPAEWHYYKAELIAHSEAEANAKSPIDLAIEHLETSIQLDPDYARSWCKLGELYQKRTTHGEHLRQAADAYLKVMELSRWGPNSVHKWMQITIRYYPQNLLKVTNIIPWDKRLPEVFVMRATVHMMMDQVGEAWAELIRFFEDFHYDEQVYEKANEIALKIEPPVFMLRMHTIYQEEHYGKDWPDAALSVMYARNGNRAYSERYLQQAQLMRVQNSVPEHELDLADCED